MNKILGSIMLLVATALIFTACKKDDPGMPPNIIKFQASELGFAQETNELTVTLELNYAETVALPVTLSVEGTGIVAGTDFTTTPALESNGSLINLSIPAGTTSYSFKVKRSESGIYSGDETIKFKITSAGTLLMGNPNEITIKFSSIVSTGAASFTLDGTTNESAYGNGVYFDFSTNTATAVDRKSWNIAFATGADFRVLVNPGNQTLAAKISKTDINTAITDNDLTGVKFEYNIMVGELTPNTYSDDFTGDLSKTVFGDIAASEQEAKIVIVGFEGNVTRDKLFKVKVFRSGNGYKLQYAKLASTDIKTVDITKDASFNLIFYSLENSKIVTAEPKAKEWDIQWSYSTYNATPTALYFYQDFILLNRLGGASAVEVVAADQATAEARFTAFKESDLAGLTFSVNRDVIGSNWRVTSGATVGIKRDRFYVVKDADGNVYKLRFLKFGAGGDGGTRGKPEIEYRLVKKA